MLLETFIIVMVMMSLCFYILFAVNGIQSGTNCKRRYISVFRHTDVHLHFYANAFDDVYLFSS